MAKSFYLDLVNLTQIFASTTLELVTLRNATRAQLCAPIIRGVITPCPIHETCGTVWSAAGHSAATTVQEKTTRLSSWEINTVTSQLNATRLDKSSLPKARRTVEQRPAAIRLSP